MQTTVSKSKNSGRERQRAAERDRERSKMSFPEADKKADGREHWW